MTINISAFISQGNNWGRVQDDQCFPTTVVVREFGQALDGF